MKLSFSELMNMDDELFQLASYEASEGLVPLLLTPEELLEFKRKSAAIFNEYKLGIQRGSFDLHYIRNRVSKFGPIFRKYKNNEELIEDIIQGVDTETIIREPSDPSFNELLDQYEKASEELSKIGKEGQNLLEQFLNSRDSEANEILPLDELDDGDDGDEDSRV